MPEMNLLDAYPRIKRNIGARAAFKDRTPENRLIAKKFGLEYFDGTRDQGYGGYFYDGRWKAVARRIIDYYKLPEGARVLDVGSGKGFLLYDFQQLLPGVRVAGIDLSQYGLRHTIPSVKPFCVMANATHLPFPDKSFDLVVSINVAHNLPRELCVRALREMERVSKKHKYVQVDSYRNEQEKVNLENWQLTAELIYSTDEWISLFKEVGYTGEYYWTITE